MAALQLWGAGWFAEALAAKLIRFEDLLVIGHGREGRYLPPFLGFQPDLGGVQGSGTAQI